MSRPLRLEFEGALYHITARGDRREPIFEDDADRHILIHILGQGMDRFDASVFAYCLMNNHYHFVLQTRRANLSRLMRHINGVYTQTYNRRHASRGMCFKDASRLCWWIVTPIFLKCAGTWISIRFALAWFCCLSVGHGVVIGHILASPTSRYGLTAPRYIEK